MIRRGLASALVVAALLAGPVHADQGTGQIEDARGVGVCDLDAPVYDEMPSSSECGHVNGDDYVNQAPAGGDD